MCAVESPDPLVGSVWTQYIYDAEGNRVAKGKITNQSVIAAAATNQKAVCDVTQNGFTLTNTYALGLGGEQVTEMGQDGQWLHSNAYVGGQLLATYDDDGVHFQITDWLGSRRVQTDYLGRIEETYPSLPFGEMLPQNNYVFLGATEQHFTGKERDTESGNDYFVARYYASTTGRMISPDPSGLMYADKLDPQSFNLYSYVRDNPLTLVDPTGLYYECTTVKVGVDSQGNGGKSSQNCKWIDGPLGDGLIYMENMNELIAQQQQQALQSNSPAAPSISANTNKAPSNATPWYKTCTAQALFSGAGSIAIDSIGLIPEAEGFTKVFENEAGYQIARSAGNSLGYRGIVATQQGAKAVTQGKGAISAISGAFGLGDTSAQGRLSTGLTVAGFIPVLGTAAASASIGVDGYKTWKAVSQCP